MPAAGRTVVAGGVPGCRRMVVADSCLGHHTTAEGGRCSPAEEGHHRSIAVVGKRTDSPEDRNWAEGGNSAVGRRRRGAAAARCRSNLRRTWCSCTETD